MNQSAFGSDILGRIYRTTKRVLWQLDSYLTGVLEMLVRSRLLFTLKPYPSLKPGLLRRLYTTMPPPTLAPLHSLALPETEDDPTIRQKYRPFLIEQQQPTAAAEEHDWISALELNTALSIVRQDLHKPSSQGRLKVLVLYGSLRRRSYSKLVAFEAARILFRLGCDVRVFDPEGLPVKNEVDIGHDKVLELRGLSTWSDGHVWVSPEQHGNLVSPFPLLSSCLILSQKRNREVNKRADCSIQKPTRLDPAKHRQHPPNTRPHARHCPSMRRLAVLQRRELPPPSRSVDAHVHDPESVVDSQGVHAFSGGGGGGGSEDAG